MACGGDEWHLFDSLEDRPAARLARSPTGDGKGEEDDRNEYTTKAGRLKCLPASPLM